MNYENIKTALYCVIFSLEHTEDWGKFDEQYSFIEQYIHIDKVYLETYRWDKIISEKQLIAAKEFFTKKGITTSGGITTSRKAKEKWQFSSFCYSDKHYINELEKAITLSAKHFNEVILDDFYFTNCKCDKCIKEKGERTWWEFRTQQLKLVSEKLMHDAKKTNPDVQIILKYPNWYDEYQYTGYNLQDQSQIFDALYTGTESRDPSYTQQNLPRYLSYFLMRYLENVKPGKNYGGWFDPFDCSYDLNSYLEQSYLTMFAKAKEITLFCMQALVGEYTQFVPLAGYSFQRVNAFLGKLGKPLGIACYKPYNSSGENYLLPTLGMLGLPLEPYPDFPENEDVILLSQSASYDNDLLEKVKGQLKKGKTVIMTSGLAKVLTGKGLEDIVDLDFTGDQVSVKRMAIDFNYCAFNEYFELPQEIIIPHIEYHTNDCWAVTVAQSQENGYPLLLRSDYSEGELIVVTIPEKSSDLYHYPVGVLDSIRKVSSRALPMYISAPAKIGLFLYDNNTFIIESFLPHNCPVTIVIKCKDAQIIDLESEEIIAGLTIDDETHILINCRPSMFRALKILK